MTLARIALGVCAALALTAAGFDADAKGRSGAHSGSGSGGHHSHHHHHRGGYGFHTRTFVATRLIVWPSGYYGASYYAYPSSRVPAPVAEYWYYCEPYAAYYPYVQECPTEWQPVLPVAPSPES
ncbi:MAG TPA: hypothetical protein VNU64_22680 [Burkholderiales bacterium]|nr:hypothetical protein [Burkholderiales bacterium]